MANARWDAYAATVNSPEFQKWVQQGRATIPPYSAGVNAMYDSAMTQVGQLRAEDKKIGQYYKLTTGQDATEDVINKYAQYANDPALLTAAINKDVAVAPSTGTYKDKINAIVQEKMGRAATEAEQESFGKLMEQGNLDAYGLGEFLGGTTEYQTKASDTARAKLATELGGVDTEYLNKVQKALESKYAAAGRSGSSAFGSALISAGKDLATERTGYLAGLGYQDFQQGQGNLTAAYQNRLAQMYANQQGTAALGSESRSRYYSQQDYDRQLANQERLRKLSQGSSGSFLQQITPGLITAAGTIGGALIGGPAGAGIGATVGSSVGSAYNRNPRLNTSGYYGGY